MKNKKVVSSLMLAGVVLSSVSPLVGVADTNGDKIEKSVNSTNSSMHVLGSRFPDAQASDAGAGKFDLITVNGIQQTKLGDQYVTKIAGYIEAEVGSHYATMTFKSESGKVLASRQFTPGNEIANAFTDTITDDVVDNVMITINRHDGKQHVMAYYELTDDEKPAQPNTMPVINASDKTVKAGDTFDPMSGVTATDAEDGDLTSKIKVTSNDVDTSKAGIYHVTYSVTDSDGNVTEKTITVVVGTNSKPVIGASDKTLRVNDSFDPLRDITATDAEDGDLTSKIKVTSNDVDMSKAGIYHVTYSVTDSDGNVTEKTITVTVESNNKPVINASDKAVKVGDTFDPLKDITATDAEDGDLTGSVTVKTNDVDTSKAGTYHVTYSVTDSDGNVTEKTIKVVVSTNSKPVINASDKNLKVNDSYDPLKDVTATDAEDGDLTGSVTVKTNDVDTSKAGTYHVTYSVTDSDGNVTEKTITITVEEKNTVGSITPAEYDLSEVRSITGTYEGDVAKLQVEVNGEMLPIGGTLTDGTFKYYVGSHITKTTDQVFVIALDKDGKQLDKKQVTIVKKETAGSITPAEYDLSKVRSITGTYEGDVAKLQVEVNGEMLPVGGTLTDGTFEYYIGSHITKTTDKVFVIALDADGKQLDRKQVTITKSETSGKIIPDVDDFTTERSITGTYEGDVAKLQVEVNGEMLPVGGTLTDGHFKYYVGSHITKTTDKVFVIALDTDGKQLDREQVTITKSETSGKIIPNVYNLSETNSITGTYEGDVAKLQVEVNGKQLSAGGTLSGGQFKYYIGTNIKNTTDKVYVTAYDQNNKELDKKLVTIVAE